MPSTRCAAASRVAVLPLPLPPTVAAAVAVGTAVGVAAVPVPEPAAGEVRVRVQACGISFFDLLIARGGYQWRPGLPFTVGSEFAGVVEALGPGTTGLAVGDRVGGSVSIGAWCQQLCVAASALHPVAPGASLDEAAVAGLGFAHLLFMRSAQAGQDREAAASGPARPKACVSSRWRMKPAWPIWWSGQR